MIFMIMIKLSLELLVFSLILAFTAVIHNMKCIYIFIYLLYLSNVYVCLCNVKYFYSISIYTLTPAP